MAAAVGTSTDIHNVAQYVLSLSKSPYDSIAAYSGKAKFAACAACHGVDGKGNQALGAPNLSDNVWLHGWGEAAIAEIVNNGKTSVMPAQRGRLTGEQIHVLASYVWSCRILARPPRAEAAAVSRIIPIAAVPPATADGLALRQRREDPGALGARMVRRLALGHVWLTQVLFYGLPWLQWNGRPRSCSTSARAASTSSPWSCIPGRDLPRRPAHPVGLQPVPVHRRRRAPLVRLRMPADGLHRDLHVGRAALRRRSPGAHQARRSAVVAAQDRPPRRQAGGLAAMGLWTGFTFVAYFTPARTLGAEVLGFALGPWETFWILFYGLATYGNAGYLREQVCKYMCPYARFQSAMFDRDTLIVSYDPLRGEPRGSRKRGVDPASIGKGECIDCTLCVQVCPTGIDIRKGLQYECIGCAACIDVCNGVMDKMSYPRGLIRFATQNAMAQSWSRRTTWKRVARPRVLVYGTVLAALGSAFVYSLATRAPIRADVVRDRGTLARMVEGGRIENVYRLQLMNATEAVEHVRVEVEGLPGASVAAWSDVDLARDRIALGSRGRPDRPGAGELAAARRPPDRVPHSPGRAADATREIRADLHEKSTFIVPR
jgi:polyferredoxin/cytochrome c553